ncbi:MerC domain-containing protein [Spartinivicinus poritis]|uniref:MerC domain-containing protein n=1 Tax=Spartinivicinus poritis TaxID=2994640 RepID=A0ABT5UHJ0_9GAMM|nr:MerC domain-containing protein [Spartinivicinus sp. A2-2]MDE1465865.1 MerC domain-containing protein [Spartinivicinus sp. A2-2]
MKNIQTTLDKAAVGVSFLCVAHCLLIPVVIVIIPTVVSAMLSDEVFHKVLILFVLPTSILALIMGWQKHKAWSVILLGAIGLLIITLAALYGHDIVGEAGEKWATIIGSIVIALSHYKNQKLCRNE